MESRSDDKEMPLVPTEPLTLTREQREAFQTIHDSIRSRQHQVFLLHGITGSGKTEIYLQAIAEVLAHGQTAIVLVPEISLTPQTIERFKGRFGQKTVAILHSRMLESRRLQEWYRVKTGEARVVIGARSAVFAPVSSLGMIVIDEEHETSYKQEDAPRYHARDVAVQRALLAHAPVILGSATPSMESYYEATHNRYKLLSLRKRIEEVPLPEVTVVDMREEIRVRRGKPLFSRALEKAVSEVLTAKQQAILFLNRRGFSTIVQCRRCGHVLRCSACEVSLTYHIATQSMVCHYCSKSFPAPEICPKCDSDYVRFQGLGTQRVESELARRFPEARIARLDTDSTRRRGSHEKVLTAFRNHEIDVVVGTQMIAKGLDFPRVTLVGVISADTALNLPDFRSAERTFNLMTQVAGRAGRGTLPGKVIFQTYAPHHYAIEASRQHDYHSFYNQEIEIRHQLKLPPWTRLAQVMVRSLKENKALDFAHRIAQECRARAFPGLEVLGPSPAVIHRLRRQYRWQLLLKASTRELLQGGLELIRKSHPPPGCFLVIDVDPL